MEQKAQDYNHPKQFLNFAYSKLLRTAISIFYGLNAGFAKINTPILCQLL